LERIENHGIPSHELMKRLGENYATAVQLNKTLKQDPSLQRDDIQFIMESAEVYRMHVTDAGIRSLDTNTFTEEQIQVLKKVEGQIFIHTWVMDKALAELSPSWAFKKDDEQFNRELQEKLSYIHGLFHTTEFFIR